MPSLSSPTPSFFFWMPALKAGSKSFASFTREPGLTRNGSMNREIRFVMSSGMSVISFVVAGRGGRPIPCTDSSTAARPSRNT